MQGILQDYQLTGGVEISRSGPIKEIQVLEAELEENSRYRGFSILQFSFYNIECLPTGTSINRLRLTEAIQEEYSTYRG